MKEQTMYGRDPERTGSGSPKISFELYPIKSSKDFVMFQNGSSSYRVYGVDWSLVIRLKESECEVFAYSTDTIDIVFRLHTPLDAWS
jgi:hypothetical protein